MNRLNRRDFLKDSAALSAVGAISYLCGGCRINPSDADKKRPPNVVLVLTDDQGYGDIGLHGNPHLRTPTLDAFARQSARFNQFYVSPVCAPTRASLMTGRYNYRTGVVDTYLGRAMMHPDEITLAEILKANGYATALFGKWHLGDNTPMRPQDKGFDEVIMHLGGGLGQPSDPPGGSSYYDPLLFHNGKLRRFKGYCMDIYTNAAIHFAKQHKNRPFFIYLATNTPHTPLDIASEDVAYYRSLGLSEKTAKVYAMIENIDRNFQRLLDALDQEGLTENTIVIFMGDNGPCLSSVENDRYMAGLRAAKGRVYENGIRAPFFIRWPKRFAEGRVFDAPAAHIDLMPTLLDACGIPLPSERAIDGISLLPLLTGAQNELPERPLFFQWHRGDAPQRYRCFAVRQGRYKLLQAKGIDKPPAEQEMTFELYDLQADPGETTDIAAQRPDIVQTLKTAYDRWFDEVVTERTIVPPRIHIGSNKENPITLTRQDWRGAGGWTDSDVGYWLTQAAQSGRYTCVVEFSDAANTAGAAYLALNDKQMERPIFAGQNKAIFENIQINAQEARISGWMKTADGQIVGARYLHMRRQ